MTRLPDVSGQALDVLDLVKLPVWVFSLETLQILTANQAAQDWLGYDLATLRSMTIADLRPESERQRIFEKVRRFAGLTTDAGTWTIAAKSGEHFIGHFAWSKVTYDGSLAVVASIRDMTPYNRAEAQASQLKMQNQRLREKANLSADHLARLVNGLPGKMLVLTPGDYTVVAVTDEYAQAVMLDRSTMIGQRLFDLFPDDPNDPAADGVAKLRASLKRVEALRVTDVMKLQRYPVRRPAGTFEERFWLPTNKPVLDAHGDIAHIVHRVEDVTRVLDAVTKSEDKGAGLVTRELLEARSVLLALQERETRLNATDKLLALGWWEIDLASGRVTWSDRMFEIHGVPRGSPAPDFDDYMSFVHPDDRDEVLRQHKTFAESGASERLFEHRIIRPDGSVAYVRGVGSRHRVDDKEIVVGFVQDTTSMHQAEEQLRREAKRRRFTSRLICLGGWQYEVGQGHVTFDDEVAAIIEKPEIRCLTIDQAAAYFIPEHRARIRARFDNCFGAGASYDEICQIVSAKGRKVWVRAIGEPVRDASGAIIGIEGAFQDVSDLIAARDAAAELSDRLRATLEDMSDAFFLLNENWNFAFVNTKAEELLCRPNGSLLGRNIWEEFPEVRNSTIEKEYRRAVEDRCPVRFEVQYAPLDAWYEISATPTPQGLAVYFQDITLERARNQQLRILETAAANLNDILLITEAEPIDAPEGPKIVYVNGAFEKRTGFTREEVIGKTPRILQGPRTQRAELDRIRKAMEKWKPVRSELINYTKTGEDFWLELDIVPLADETGWYTHWVSVERDITDRKRAEDALKANEERFRLVTQAAGSAIWDWEARTDQQWWSDGLKEIFGHSPDATRVWSDNVHPDDFARVDAAFERLLVSKDSTWRDTYRFRRANGSWAFVEDNAIALHDEAGRTIRVLGIMTDVTEKSQLEERLRQAQKMEMMGQLTGGIAHDFNNLLMIILGSSEILEDSLAAQPTLQKLARMALDAADRGATLTSQLLSFSRKQPLQPKDINITKLLQRMESMLRRTLPESIEITTAPAHGMWRIQADAAQLESAILNLAINARDAMPQGGSLTIEAANVTLDGSCPLEPDVSPGQYVVITVTDTGHGIPEDDLGRIFEPFFTTKDVGKGSGLGLSMVFGFVKQSGGHIRVASEPGRGTTFRLYFHRTEARERASTGRTKLKVVGGSESILVVEDDPSVRGHVSEQLRELGYQVHEASSGREALAVLQGASAIDLLFTDVVMPGGMGGRELAEAAAVIQPHIAVLFTSGYSENAISHDGKLDDGLHLLAKPYRRDQLAAKVREVLEQKATGKRGRS